MAAASLPGELLAAIIAHLDNERDLAAAALACRTWFRSFNPALYSFNSTRNSGSCIDWALANDRMCTVDRAVDLIGAYVFHIHHLMSATASRKLPLIKTILANDQIFTEWETMIDAEVVMPVHTLLSPTGIATANRDLQALELLLNGTGHSTKSLSGIGSICEPLIVAAYLGYMDVVKFLLDTNRHSENKWQLLNALQAAVCMANPAITRVLCRELSSLGRFHEFARESIPYMVDGPHAGSELKEAMDELLSFIERFGGGIRQLPRIPNEADALACFDVVLNFDFKTHQTYYDIDRVLLRTAEAGRLTMAKSALRRGADATGDDGDKAIRSAASSGDVNMVRALLNAGCNANGNVNYSWEAEPLFLAVRSGSHETVKVLLQHHARVRIWQDKRSPLHEARCPKIAKALLQAGIPVDIVRDPESHHIHGAQKPDPQGRFQETPLLAACTSGAGDVGLVLLDAGANPMVVDYFAHTTLHLAACTGLRDVVKRLAECGVSIHEASNYTLTPLHDAALHNHPNVVDLLLHLGADLHAKTKWGAEPIDRAVHYREVIEVLIKHGLDLNAPDKKGQMIMHRVARQISPLVCGALQNLLETGAELEAKDGNGYTPLHRAIETGNQLSAQFLVKRGADINSRNSKGWTPLMTACQRRLPDMLRFVLSTGPDMHATVSGNPEAYTALHIALLRGNCAVLSQLLEAGMDPRTSRGLGNNKCRQLIRRHIRIHNLATDN